MFKVVMVLLFTFGSGRAAFNVLKTLDGGIEIKALPNGSFKIGLVTIPANTLCTFPSFITRRLACHICAVDCTSVHNRYIGTCGNYVGKNGQVCICGDTPPPGGVVPTAVEQCGPLTIFDLPGNFLNLIVGGPFNTVIVAREDFLLCSPDSTGCNVDCDKNRQYNNGACGTNIPIPLGRGDINETEKQFCECNF